MAQKLGNVPVGTILHMKENGVYQDYLVVHQGLPSSMYDASCNGTWLLRRYVFPGTSTVWQNASGELDYSKSALNNVTQSILSAYDAETLNTISAVKIPYCYAQGGVKSGSSGMETKIFVLSPHEYGDPNASTCGVDGALLSYFSGVSGADLVNRVVCGDTYWGRAVPLPWQGGQVPWVAESGFGNALWYRNSAFSRPCIIRPTSLLVDDDGNILNAFYPTPPASITVPTSSIPSGSSISVSWSAVSGAESYQLQRSVDGGSWQTIYTGTQTSYSDTAGVWNSVKYQVATVKVGIVSGYTTSTAVTILPYTIDKLTVPSQIMAGQSVPISWSAAPAAITYILERKVNSGSWTQIYSGANKSYTDTPSGSWSTVQYRVKGGANGQYGTYKTSPSIPVISASALVISGTDGYLGTLTADIGYTVSSDTGNPISVERYVNGQLVATVSVQSGFAYTIPVMDLPTGAGTVKISASVNTSGGPVSASRTWTYDKRVVLFPEDGGPAQIQVEGKNLMPPTLAECVRVPTVWGGTMDKALELLLPLLSTAVMATGSYTGTGTFGSSSPNTLTFSFTPELVILSGGDVGLTISNTSPSGGTSDAYIQGTTAKWYSTSAAKQLNVQGKSYSYVAIGKAVQT